MRLRWLVLLLLAAALPCAAAPERPLMGIWITDIYDLDPNSHSFSAKFWVWSVLPKGSRTKPVSTLAVIRARQYTISTPETAQLNGLEWDQAEVTAVIRQHWNTRAFPFDRHTLEIIIEDNFDEDTALQYIADRRQSGIDLEGISRSWKVTGFRLLSEDHVYPTTFGEPGVTAPRSRWSRLIVQVDVQRESVGVFIKLLIAAYTAFLLAFISFYIHTDQPTLFSARLALLVGSLFATVVNLRSTESVIGRSDSFTLVDKIHFTIAVYILLAALAALASRREHDRQKPERAERRDRWLAPVFGATFVIINAAFILDAMR